MIQVFSQAHERMCLLKGYKSLAIKTKLADGDKSLTFQYPRTGTGVEYLSNECYIRTQEDEFVLKEISGGKTWRKYTAQLNLEELEGKSYVSFETVEKTVSECLQVALEGTGWTVGSCTIKKRRTIRKDNVCTAIDIIDQIISTYKVEVQYHSITKKIDIYEHLGSDKGAYFMEAVNLRKPPDFSSSSNGIYTQIRPIGKNGLTINVNGKDYIENHAYSPKNIMMTWKDERYTIASSLLEDAQLKLEEICRPTVTYEVDVIDLAKTSEQYKDILSYGIGDTVSLVAKTDGIKEKMRIAVITQYPDAPQNNTCQLSTAKKTFTDVQQEVIEEATSEATATAAANTTETVDNESDITSDEISLQIEGLKTEVLKIVDDTYLEKEAAESVAEAAATAAAEASKEYTDTQLESYVTEDNESRDIEAAKKAVLLQASQTYATKQQMQDAQTATQQNVSDQIAEAEESKNDIVDASGTVWRMGFDKGCLYFEELEAEG